VSEDVGLNVPSDNGEFLRTADDFIERMADRRRKAMSQGWRSNALSIALPIAAAIFGAVGAVGGALVASEGHQTFLDDAVLVAVLSAAAGLAGGLPVVGKFPQRARRSYDVADMSQHGATQAGVLRGQVIDKTRTLGCDDEGLQRCCHLELLSRGSRAGGPFSYPPPGSLS
jgi:hypothetical protein